MEKELRDERLTQTRKEFGFKVCMEAVGKYKENKDIEKYIVDKFYKEYYIKWSCRISYTFECIWVK